MRKFIFPLITLLLLFPTVPLLVKADTVLPFGTTATGTLSSSNLEDVYTIIVPEKGTVRAKVGANHSEVLVELRDVNNKSIETLHRFYQGGPDDPTWTQPVLLEPGEYHFVVKKAENMVSKDYNLTISYLKADNNEIEPNQSIEEAMPLQINGDRVKGLINGDDKIDYYKIEISEPGRLWMDVKSNMPNVGFMFYDAKGDYIYMDVAGPSYDKAVDWKQYIDLEAGTYYFRVTGGHWEQGLYTIGATFTPSNTREAEPNNSMRTAVSISAGKTYTGFLSLSDKDDFYKFDMLYDGYVTLDFSSEFSSYYFMLGEMESMPAYHYFKGQLGKPELISKRMYLTKGTYYVQAHKYDQGGVYTFSIQLESELGRNFTDVSSIYLPAVKSLLKQEVTTGLTKTTFGTTEKIKRVDAAIWLAKILKLDTSNQTAPSFLDAPKRAWGSINALKKAGIASGKSTIYFGANDNVTRGEMALMIQKAYNLYGNEVEMPFIDVSSRYHSAVRNLVRHKITSGKTPTMFGTNMSITRGEMALFLYRAEAIKIK